MVIADKNDWNVYRNATKLMVMNYWQMRNASDCGSCRRHAELKLLEEAEEEAIDEEIGNHINNAKRHDASSQPQPPKKESLRVKYSHNPNLAKCNDYLSFMKRLDIVRQLTWTMKDKYWSKITEP